MTNLDPVCVLTPYNCSIVVEFEGWIFVYLRMAFGWRWATHVFGMLGQAVKDKLNSFSKTGWFVNKRLDAWEYYCQASMSDTIMLAQVDSGSQM